MIKELVQAARCKENSSADLPESLFPTHKRQLFLPHSRRRQRKPGKPHRCPYAGLLTSDLTDEQKQRLDDYIDSATWSTAVRERMAYQQGMKDFLSLLMLCHSSHTRETQPIPLSEDTIQRRKEKTMGQAITGLFHKEKLNVGKRPLCRELWVLYKCSMTLDILRL